MTDVSRSIAGLSAEKRELLALLLREQGVELERALIVPQPRDSAEFPVSFGQERLWFLDQFEPGSPYYNIPTAVRLDGVLDVPALARAVQAVVDRHEALRTVFVARDGRPVQRILPALEVPLPQVDLEPLPAGEREAAMHRLAMAEARKPFDLAAGPLVRATLVRLHEREHVVLFTMHHIVSDGWSIGVLIGEVGAHYAAHAAGRTAGIAPLAIQYPDFAVWQRQRLAGPELERQLAWWREQLGGDVPVLRLPTDRPRPAVQTSRGDVEHLRLPAELLAGLYTVARRENATLFMTLLAGFQALLYRYTGQEEFTVGTPIAGRTRPELEPLIGLFINTLVLRGDLSGDPAFRELVGRVRETALGAFQHQDLPFEHLVEALQPERDLSHPPLFQVMFILQNAQGKVQRLPGLTLSQVESHSGTSTFDLTLMLSEQPDGLVASLEYNTDLFDPGTARRLLAHYRHLLEGAVAAPDTPVSELPLLGAAERCRVLEEWNATGAAWDFERCVHQLFAEQAARTPDREAAVAPDGSRIRYAELDRRANQLARHLQTLGVGPGTLVGICADKSLDLLVGLLGILKAGGAYVPMDPTYPADRIAWMLEDADVPVLLTQSHLEAGLPPHRAAVVRLDADRGLLDALDDAPVASPARPDDLAYVIYTSGSTGKPKGVMIEHRSLVNQYLAWEEPYRLRSRPHRHLQMASFSFDVFTGDLARALCSGGTLVLVPRELLLEPERLVALARAERVTIAEFVPAVLRQVVQHLDLKGERLEDLELVLCGSDSWNVSEYLRFRRLLGEGTRLVNSFGLTEATIDSTWFEADTLDPAQGDQMVPIGRPFANTTLYVVDRHLRPVPVGVPGELLVGGPGLARGYRNRPDLTAEKFVAHPFSADPAARVYRTGDLARWRADGNVEFLGRMDHQVKIRGYRVEPGEIEAVLGRHEGLEAAVVLARPAPAGDLRLVAYVVPGPGATVDERELRAFLAERLPDYMVPSVFMVLERFPLTPNGKLDRKALPAPDWGQRSIAEAYVAPRTPTEQAVADLFAEVLGVEQVGAHDGFFQLGGHSLLATQVVSRIRDRLGADVPLRALFEAPTVAALAARVDGAGTGAAPAEPIARTRRDAPPPLSFGQQRLWFLDQLEPDSAAYNIPAALRLQGRLDAEALERALGGIVRRHEVLRTTFASVDGTAVQVIAEDAAVPLVRIDLRHLEPAARDAEARRLAAEEARRPFDLARGPLVRATLLRLGDDEHVALFTMHHIVSDGWSTGVLVRELSALYAAEVRGVESPLPELPVQYADYAAWQRERLSGERLESQLAWWRERLAGLPVLELPTDRPRPPVQTSRGGRRTFTVDRRTAAALHELGGAEGATPFMTLLAAWQSLLQRYSGQEDIAVGTPMAGRVRPELEGLIGFFVNTLVLRTDLSGEPTFRELVRRVRETALGAYQHQEVPFEQVVDAVQPVRDLSRTPLFQVMFILQNAPTGRLELPGLALEALPADTGAANFDLTLTLEETADGLAGELEYNADLFEPGTIDRMLAHFRRLLEGVAADPDRPVSRVPLLDQTERRLVLEAWNATDDPSIPTEACLHELVAAQARRTPDAVAVLQPAEPAGNREARRLTFAELDARANRLAHHLAALGVRAGTLVGLCVERSPEMLVSLLGILKAGGAYVPLDPAHPAERLAFQLADSAVPVLVTQADLEHRLPLGDLTPPPVVVRVDADWGTIGRWPAVEPVAAVRADDPAYVIYTSGSTGTPKGVEVSHRSVVNHNCAMRTLFGLTPEDRVLQFATLTFDAAVEEIFPTLMTGATLVLRPGGALPAPSELMRTVEAEGVTVLDLPTAYWHAWVGERVVQPDRLPRSLRLVVVGGEAAGSEQLAHWRELGGAELLWINTYGPTEGTVVATAYPVSPGVPAPVDRPVPIGRPIANVRAYVLDRHGEPTPVGVPGELYLGGAGVARGYLGRPVLTAERFVPDPFAGRPEARLYRTGDRVRWRGDGELEFLGRTDDQVKIRGFRVEIGEVEAALRRHPAVRDAAVAAVQDPADGGGPSRLVAYLVADVAVDRVPWVAECRVARGLGGDEWSEEIPLRSHDLSPRGLCLELPPEEWRVGERLRIRAVLPGGTAEERLEGLVAWREGSWAGVRLALDAAQTGLLARAVRVAAEAEGVAAADLRRSEPRVPLRATCQVDFGDGSTRELVLENLSRGGLRLLGAEDLAMGSRLRVHLALPGAPESFWVDGLVWWQSDGRAGIRFDSAQAERERLRDAVESLMQSQSVSLGDVRAFLRERLPEYMVPSGFVLLDALPLTPNGKVDRRALPAPDPREAAGEFVAPASSVEETLAGIWAGVLGRPSVSVHDNFFELGGDSILAIQVLARARQAGIHLSPRHLFQAPTVAGLAQLAGTVRAVAAEQGLVEGPVPFTPIQRWFVEQRFVQPQHWNQSLLFRVDEPLDPVLLRETVAHLLRQHDALRLRFQADGDGWTQRSDGAPGADAIPFAAIDLADLSPAEQGAAVEAIAGEQQASLDLTRGPLIRVAWFTLGEGLPGRLLFVVHHLAVDGVSWRILLEDFRTIYGQLAAGREVRLPPKTTSYREWAERLQAWAASPALQAEVDHWQGVAAGRVARLPLDRAGGSNTEASAAGLVVELDDAETRALLEEVPARYHTEINDALLTAVAQAVARWTGTRTVLVELEGHGREDLFDDVDLSRTVGWFTTTYPVRLDLGDAAGPGEALKRVKEQLRRVPRRGIGYGVLRWLGPDRALAARLAAAPQPEIVFNYLGQVHRTDGDSAGFAAAPERSGPERSPAALRAHLIEVNGSVTGGRLRMEWTYSEHLHARTTVQRVADDFAAALRALVAHCRDGDAGGHTPSDFGLAKKLDQRQLDKVLAKFSGKKKPT